MVTVDDQEIVARPVTPKRHVLGNRGDENETSREEPAPETCNKHSLGLEVQFGYIFTD